MTPLDRPVAHRHPRFYLCGGCDHYHRFGWTGDCRVNAERFTADDLDRRYPDMNGKPWWLEVDERTGQPT